MNTLGAQSESSDDRFCSHCVRPDLFPPSPTESLLQQWRPPPHSCILDTASDIVPACWREFSLALDVRAKSTPPCDYSRRVHQIYPSPPLTDAALASTVPLPELPGEQAEPPFGWPDREEIVDENMSHDGAQHLAPLSPPPTLLVQAKELPAENWSKGAEHCVESWTYGDGPEDGGASAPSFPPLRDDSGFEEVDSHGGCETSRELEGSHDDRVMIEPTSVWSPHSPLSINDALPLIDLPPLHGGDPSSGPHDSLFMGSASQSAGWAFALGTNWSESPSGTLVDGLSTPPSPKPSTFSLDSPDFGFSLGLSSHPSSNQQQQPPLISSLDIPFQHQDRHWYLRVTGGDSSSHEPGRYQDEPHQSFLSPFHQISLHPPSDADLDSDYSDTVMPSEDEGSTSLLPPSSPRRRKLNELHETTPPHGDLCPTPAPHSPRGALFSLPDIDMEDPSEPPGSPHSPHRALPELEDEEMHPMPTEQLAPLETISPSLLGGAPPPEREGLGLFLQPVSIDPPLARSPSPDEDDLQFLDVQLDPASTNLEVDEFLQLRALRKAALQQERAARLAEAELNERVTAAASALLPPAHGDPDAMQMELDPAEKRARKRELHAVMDMRAEARRMRKLQKQRSKEIGALLDLKMQTPISPIEGFPPIAMGGGKSWTRSIAHLVAHMILKRRDRNRPLENRPPPSPSMRKQTHLRASVSAEDLLCMAPEGYVDVDADSDMEE
ncbi:hypothetical protein BD414DRAFT_498433 [Trametes punicea]|nr:hypothetical protein BD414DRAFT_498433 [Trametes punicea]